MSTWGEIKRSTTPLPWRRMLQELCFSPNETITYNKVIERTNKVMEKYFMSPENDEVVDMNEADKSQEVLDETTVDETETEPDSTLDSPDEFDEDAEESSDDDDDDDLVSDEGEEPPDAE